MTESDDAVELQLATLDQIADELEKRYGAVLIGVHRTDPGTLMCKRGDMTMALGVHWELGEWLACKWHEVPTHEADDGN